MQQLLLSAVVVDVVLQTLVGVSLVFFKHFLIGNEAMQDGRNAHAQHVHEDVADKVRNDKNDTERSSNGVQLIAHILGNDVVSGDRDDGTDKELSNNQDSSRYVSNGRHTPWIAEYQGKRFAT